MRAIRSIKRVGDRGSAFQLLLAASICLLSACTNDARASANHAASHVTHLVSLTVTDVAEVRNGLPLGVPYLRRLWAAGPAEDDPEAVADRLQSARSKVQDLRVAKSTFFALSLPDGAVVRNDQLQDLMAGKNLFASYPGLKAAIAKGYSEDVGSMHEARGVEGRPDAQWVAAAAVKNEAGAALGLYVTGWSWAHYARRLEEGLQAHLRDVEADTGKKKPLLYVFIIVGNTAYGTRAAPAVNAQAIQNSGIIEQLEGEAVLRKELEITGRDFGLAVQRAPSLGATVAIGVLRSET